VRFPGDQQADGARQAVGRRHHAQMAIAIHTHPATIQVAEARDPGSGASGAIALYAVSAAGRAGPAWPTTPG
jgi:hypothetical protein